MPEEDEGWAVDGVNGCRMFLGRGNKLVLGGSREDAKTHSYMWMLFIEGVEDGRHLCIVRALTLRCGAVSEWGEGGKK